MGSNINATIDGNRINIERDRVQYPFRAAVAEVLGQYDSPYSVSGAEATALVQAWMKHSAEAVGNLPTDWAGNIDAGAAYYAAQQVQIAAHVALNFQEGDDPYISWG